MPAVFGDPHHHVTFLILVLAALATYRLTRLVTTDVITERPRSWLRTNYTGWLVTLIHCPWCLGVWVAVPVVLLTVYAGEWWLWVMVGLAASAVTGFLTERE